MLIGNDGILPEQAQGDGKTGGSEKLLHGLSGGGIGVFVGDEEKLLRLVRAQNVRQPADDAVTDDDLRLKIVRFAAGTGYLAEFIKQIHNFISCY